MNWYKKALTQESQAYWQDYQEMADEGENYIPDQNEVNQTLNQQYQTKINKDLGCGDRGCAYHLANGDVLKVTTDKNEAAHAQHFIQNPHPNVAPYKSVWQRGNLYYILMGHVEGIGNSALKPVFDQLEKVMDANKCHNPFCAFSVISRMPQFPYQGQILSYLQHLGTIKGKAPYDFLNSNNVGLSKGNLVFFDVT